MIRSSGSRRFCRVRSSVYWYISIDAVSPESVMLGLFFSRCRNSSVHSLICCRSPAGTPSIEQMTSTGNSAAKHDPPAPVGPGAVAGPPGEHLGDQLAQPVVLGRVRYDHHVGVEILPDHQPV